MVAMHGGCLKRSGFLVTVAGNWCSGLFYDVFISLVV